MGTMLWWLFLYTWTGLHTYWLHPRSLSVERQNRAIALGYYACAPLALLPVTLPAGLVILCLGLSAVWYVPSPSTSWLLYGYFLTFLGAVLMIVPLAAYPSACVVLIRRAARRGRIAQILAIFALPLCWLALFGPLMLVIPGAIAYAMYVLWFMFHAP
jgi:hypothetical protein